MPASDETETGISTGFRAECEAIYTTPSNSSPTKCLWTSKIMDTFSDAGNELSKHINGEHSHLPVPPSGRVVPVNGAIPSGVGMNVQPSSAR